MSDKRRSARAHTTPLGLLMRLLPSEHSARHRSIQMMTPLIKVYAKANGLAGEDQETVISDLLCDLLHLIDKNNLDADGCWSRAWRHYHAETEMECKQCGELFGSEDSYEEVLKPNGVIDTEVGVCPSCVTKKAKRQKRSKSRVTGKG